MDKSSAMPAAKPKFRGTSHQYAFFVSLIAGPALVYTTSSLSAAVFAGIFAVSVSTLFGVSALYHRVHWAPKPRSRMRRLDHASIYFLISGTYAPLIAMTQDQDSTFKMLGLVWGISALGILIELLPNRIPKWISALIYVGLGWFSVLLVPQMGQVFGMVAVWGLVFGGLLYTVGAVAYATKWPKLVPSHFGYHEVFHLFVICGVAAHFAVIAVCVNR